jgi:hypothetical protein
VALCFLVGRRTGRGEKDCKGHKQKVMQFRIAQEDSTTEDSFKMTTDYSVFTQKYIVHFFLQNKIKVICHHKPFLYIKKIFSAGHRVLLSHFNAEKTK